jgi:hypothetical protein
MKQWPIAIVMLTLALPINAARAQAGGSMPDPNKVAPQYRAAAEKRREEIITINACTQLAVKDHIPKRDEAAFINHCRDTVEKH